MPDDTSDPDRRAVRLFVGHAESPVWFSEPRDFEEMHLDDELTDALRAWDADWYSSRRVDDFEWTGATPQAQEVAVPVPGGPRDPVDVAAVGVEIES